ncbi:MAG TPA: helix-turn-helix domain-containing protein [Terriglobales bacterium]|nr:helix-turn-helix domain-containing protein [Terriglobales bacterium]
MRGVSLGTGSGGNRRTISARKFRPGRRDRHAREQALVAAAAKLFASQGYDLTTTRQIAARAGCAEGLIHRYFHGKAGLLFALIQSRVSKEVAGLSERLRRAPSLEEELLQLVDWEIERMWDDRDFLRVIIPRALLDRSQGKILNRVGTSRHVPAIAERLRQFPQCRKLSAERLEALAEFIKTLGMMYGFMHPMVLRQDRKRARRSAVAITRILAANL